ncbi:MAG: toll/interleukin-1 receptor domain-containing protein [Hyphomonadaceae bacterium]
MDKEKPEAWVFVSHASADLKAVRRVRNHLEEMGAAPLMFHLRSLQKPGQFWPIIKREIEHRNFFLYCESSSAERSDWVRRERDAVERVRDRRRIRVGHVNVEAAELDLRALDEFMRQVRVFPSYQGRDAERVQPYLEALRDSGFQVYDAMAQPADTSDHVTTSMKEISETAKRGWFVPFISEAGLTPVEAGMQSFMEMEINAARAAGARIVPVLLDRVTLPPQLDTLQALVAHSRPREAPQWLVKELLGR